jgi:hypothetical protein
VATTGPVWRHGAGDDRRCLPVLTTARDRRGRPHADPQEIHTTMKRMDSTDTLARALAARHGMRARPKLLGRAALVALGLPLLARSAGAQEEGFRFSTEAAHATLSHVDPVTGFVTEVTIYAADDQGYKEKGDGGPPERVSKVSVGIDQYDPACSGGGGKLTTAQEAGGGGDPTCFARSFEGTYPGKDGGSLPEEAFAVSSHQLDGAWLNTGLTLVSWGPDGESKLVDSLISLTWAPIGGIETINENQLYHPDKFPGFPRGTETYHVNARQRQAVASGTITFDGVTYDLVSSFAVIQDAQIRLT